MEGDAEYPRHRHPNYEVILVERGVYGCELNGEELSLQPGQILVVKPGDLHQDHLRDGQRHFVIQFRLMSSIPGAPDVPLFGETVMPREQRCLGDFSRESLFLRELRLESSKDDSYVGRVQDSLLGVFFWKVVRGFRPESLSSSLRQLPRTQEQREAIALVFSKFLSGSPSVSELAEALQMSPRRLVSLCNALYSETPARLLLRFKLNRADELLRFQGKRVQEVSDELGFSNPYHFSRVYRRLRGYPPTKAGKAQGCEVPGLRSA